MPRLVKLEATPWDLELNEPFGIATGAQTVAANVLLRLHLSDGTVGLGEAAPFPAVNGENQEQTLRALLDIEPLVVGRDMDSWQVLAGELSRRLGTAKSALCAVETALLDAHCKLQGQALCTWAGGKGDTLHSDITLPTGSVQQAQRAARRAVAQGFTTLKLKVGGAPLELDAERAQVALDSDPAVELLLDGNAAFDVEGALGLLRSLGLGSARVKLFEQPTAKHDLTALAEVQQRGGIAVAADESAQDAADVMRLHALGVSTVNVKIMKSGLLETVTMVKLAQQYGMELMVGGMVESDLAMSASAGLAAGLGGFRWVDLDTPLFLKTPATTGGVRRNGSRIEVDLQCHGHGAFVAATGARANL